MMNGNIEAVGKRIELIAHKHPHTPDIHRRHEH